MIYKPYGQTGKRVSAVGFGAMQFDASRPNEANAELIPYAFERGITYFDTAPEYCNDKSEDICGLGFAALAGEREKFYVSTKAMPQSSDTADKARAAVEKSLKRLQVDKIDFYHVWCIRRREHYDLAMRPGGSMKGCADAKRKV